MQVFPVFFDAVPDTQGCPCASVELDVVSVFIQLGTPKNIKTAVRIVTVSPTMCEISPFPVFFNAVPDTQGCPCMSTEVGVASVSIQLGTTENMGKAIEIVTISQSHHIFLPYQYIPVFPGRIPP